MRVEEFTPATIERWHLHYAPRHDDAALVAQAFHRDGAEARESVTAWPSASPRCTDEFRRLGRSTGTYAIEPPTGDPP
jgi:hypothetical protein